MIVLSTLLTGFAGLIVLFWLGYAPARWLMPASLRRWTLLLAPLFGYAGFVVVAQVTEQIGLNAFFAIVATLVLATVLNALAWVMGRLAARAEESYDPLAEIEQTDKRESGRNLRLVGLLTLAAFVLTVLPLWIYGYTTTIGENWDAEIYLALGEYLKTIPQNLLSAAPPNPLLNTLLVPPYSLRTHGFSYFHAALSALLNVGSIDTLNPALALLHALSVPAAFVFLRGVWGWRARPSLLAAGLLALNPFLLWIAFNTFGMQVPALGLLPASCALSLAALRDAGSTPGFAKWLPGALGAGLLAAGLAVTYHPALTAWAAVCGLGGLATLYQWRSGWRRLISAGVVVVLATLLLSAVAQWLSVQGFISQYAEQIGGLGLTGFTLPGDALGLSLSFRELLSAGPNQQILALAVLAYRLLTLAGLVCAAGLGLWWAYSEIHRRAPGWLLRLATVAAGAIYMLAFFWPLRYPYGWFKAQSFVAFLLVAAVVGGAVRLLGRPLLDDEEVPPATRQLWRPLRLALPLVPVVPALALLATLALVLWQYRSPLRYDQEMLAVSEVRQWVQDGDPVLLSSNSRMPGRLFNGLASYYLRGADLYGQFNTANAAWDRSRPDGAYRWAILNSRERPEVYGYSDADRVWSNSLLALYRRPANMLYHVDWDRKGDYPAISPRDAFTMTIGAAQVGLAGEDSAQLASGLPAPRQLTLGLASFNNQQIDLIMESPQIGATGTPTTTHIALAPGLQTVSITVTSGSTITLATNDNAALSSEAFVRWVTLGRAERRVDLPTAVEGTPVPGVIMISLDTASVLPEVRNVIRLAEEPSDRPPISRVVLDIWKRGGSVHPDDHLGYWSFARTGDTMRFGVNPATGAANALSGAQELNDEQWVGAIGPGRYVASISIYAGDSLLQTVTDVYTFALAQGTAAQRGFTRQALGVSGLSIRRFPILFY